MTCEFEPIGRFDPGCYEEATVTVLASYVENLPDNLKPITDTWHFCEKHRKESIAELRNSYDEVEVAL